VKVTPASTAPARGDGHWAAAGHGQSVAGSVAAVWPWIQASRSRIGDAGAELDAARRGAGPAVGADAERHDAARSAAATRRGRRDSASALRRRLASTASLTVAPRDQAGGWFRTHRTGSGRVVEHPVRRDHGIERVRVRWCSVQHVACKGHRRGAPPAPAAHQPVGENIRWTPARTAAGIAPGARCGNHGSGGSGLRARRVVSCSTSMNSFAALHVDRRVMDLGQAARAAAGSSAMLSSPSIT